MTPIRKGADAFALQAMLGLCLIWGIQQVVIKLAAGDIAPSSGLRAQHIIRAAGGPADVLARRLARPAPGHPGRWRAGRRAVRLEFFFIAEGWQ
jgi:hypothetical protein